MVKSKVRFDGLDVAAMVTHWNRVALGRRVINIYNGQNGDTYLFKLDKGKGTTNLLLIVESGIRFHSSRQEYENPGAPSPFCSKLRKHLRGLRLESVQQLGNKDRVVNMVFGSGPNRHSFLLELYARGNILLTDSTYTILALLRSHEYSDSTSSNKDNDNKETNVKVQVGHAYPVTYATTLGDDQDKTETLLASSDPLKWFQHFQQQQQPPPEENSENKNNNNKKKKKGGGGLDIKALLLKQQSGVSHYGPSLIEHCLLSANISKNRPQELDQDEWNRLQQVLEQEGNRILKQLDDPNSKGYIFYHPKPTDGTNDDDSKSPNTPVNPFSDKLLLEFQPHILQQHKKGLEKLEYDSFDHAADEFFSHIQSQRNLQRAETQKAQSQQRLAKIKLDQHQRVDALTRQQELLKQQAELVLEHADMVEKAIQVVNSALDSGMDWEQLQDLIEVESIQNRNPVAMLIHKLELEQDCMVLRLPRELEEDDSESKPYMDISISLKETAHANASTLFSKYRANKDKSEKTIEASTKALNAAEETAQRQLLEVQKRQQHLTQNLQHKRKTLWFEKFQWFITTDNYLVLGGRDAQQNEQLVKRYLRPGDAYLHADVHGAASCILRAKRRRDGPGKTQVLPLSDQALREAGNFTICRSSAWTSKMVTSAWWVESHQVSKTAPTGEYLTVGSFMIRGKKNFLPPTQLEMGLGVLFRLGDDESVARHKNERRDFALMQLEQEEAEIDEDDGFVSLGRENNTIVKETPKSTLVQENDDENGQEEEEQDGITDANFVSESEIEEQPQTSENGQTKAKDDHATLDEEQNSETGTENEEETEGEGECQPVEDINQEQTPFDPPPKEKKGLSKKDRKLIKKYGSLEAARAAEEERMRAEEARNAEAETPQRAKKISQPNPQVAHKRGKKAKMKKMAKKYADQDDEDRELAMLALQAGEKEKKKDKTKAPDISETEKQAAAETMAILKKDSSLVAEKLSEQVRETLAKCVTVKAAGSSDEVVVRWDKFDADVLEQLRSFEQEEPKIAAANRLLQLKESTRVDNFSASLAGIIRTIQKYGHEGLKKEADGTGDEGKRKTKAEKEAEQESWKKTLAEEGVLYEDIDEDAVDDTMELSKLTGKPQNEDLILFAVPVCAPYQTLSKYAHRVKLTPGNMKRGKASKQCVEMFQKDSASYKDLIKNVPDNEWVQAICGDVKISAAGASKAIQKSKAKSKAKKKR